MKELFASVKPILCRRRVWLLGVAGAFVMVMVFSSGVSSYAKHRYQHILSQPEVLDAFFKDDEAAIRRVAAEYRLAYQRVVRGEVAFQSRGFLPDITIVTAVIQPERDVLMQDVPTAMKSLKPHILFIQRDIFLAFPLFLPESSDGGYVIYVPLFV